MKNRDVNRLVLLVKSVCMEFVWIAVAVSFSKLSYGKTPPPSLKSLQALAGQSKYLNLTILGMEGQKKGADLNFRPLIVFLALAFSEDSLKIMSLHVDLNSNVSYFI